MKRVFLFFLLFTTEVFGQKATHFEFAGVDSVFIWPGKAQSGISEEVQFGGISGFEYFGQSYYFVSDRAFKTDPTENSYFFRMDTLGKISQSFKFFDIKNAESIRFDTLTQKIFYTFERDDSTGVGFLNENNQPNQLLSYSMNNSEFTSDNRGIESLCFDGKNNLWFAFESSFQGMVPFFKLPFDTAKNNYNSDQKSSFLYPFDPKSCLNPDKTANANLGNGISEILPLDNDRLLVLERCFDGRQNTIKLFSATIPESGNVFIKDELFDFTINNLFLEGQKSLKPDNMEGMTWGENEAGEKILYMVSDDNFNTGRQRTLILKLKLKK